MDESTLGFALSATFILGHFEALFTIWIVELLRDRRTRKKITK